MTTATEVKKPIEESNIAKTGFLFKLAKIMRLTSLSILFAGSAAIVFAAITLVKAAEAKGMTVSAAATANAPIFLHFSKVLAVVGVILLISEAADTLSIKKYTKTKLIQYAATALCCLCAFVFAFSIAPQMQDLLPSIASNLDAQKAFHTLHETSRALFSGVIIFAWLSLIMPVFYASTTEQQ